MPIEIRELIIKATINDSSDGGTTTQSRGNKEKESIVKECVEQVLQILKDKEEK